MIKSITNFLIIFFIFQQLKSQISQIDQMELSRFAMKLLICLIITIYNVLLSCLIPFMISRTTATLLDFIQEQYQDIKELVSWNAIGNDKAWYADMQSRSIIYMFYFCVKLYRTCCLRLFVNEIINNSGATFTTNRTNAECQNVHGIKWNGISALIYELSSLCLCISKEDHINWYLTMIVTVNWLFTAYKIRQSWQITEYEEYTLFILNPWFPKICKILDRV